MSVVDVLERECARAGAWLPTLSEGDWRLPTRCPPMTVHELAAHAWRGSSRLFELFAAGLVDDEPEKDGVSYYRYDPAVLGPAVLRRARETATRFASGAELAEAWARDWPAALGESRAMLAREDPVLRGPLGTIRLSEYLRTRIVEVTVHHMDLRDALGLDPDPDPGALEATGDVLRGLLGTDLRPLGTDDVRFVLTGTGRGPLDDRDREVLGPLADLYPLLS